MRLDGFKVHGAAVLAVLCTGVGYVLAGVGGTEVTLAGPQVLRLIQQAPAALSSYASLKMTMSMRISSHGQSVNVREDALMSPDGKTGSFVVHPVGVGHDVDLLFIDHTIYAPLQQATSRPSPASIGWPTSASKRP